MPRCFGDDPVQELREPKGSWLKCRVCGHEKRVFSSAACNAGVCEEHLADNDNPELQRLLRDEAFRRGVNKGNAA